MNLYRLKISGVPFDDNQSYTDVELNGNDPYLADTTNPSASDYDDISSVTNWHSHWMKVKRDYKRYRDKIKDIAETRGIGEIIWQESDPANIWTKNVGDKYEVIATAVGDFIWKEWKIAERLGASWTFKYTREVWYDVSNWSEQLIFCEHKIWTHDQRVATVWFTNALMMWMQYNGRMIPVRQYRVWYATWIVHNYLPDDAKTLFDWALRADMDAAMDRYIKTWIEWTLIGDPPWLSDWIYWTWLCVWNWLIDQPFTPEEWLTMQQLCDSARDIIHNGNFYV